MLKFENLKSAMKTTCILNVNCAWGMTEVDDRKKYLFYNVLYVTIIASAFSRNSIGNESYTKRAIKVKSNHVYE